MATGDIKKTLCNRCSDELWQRARQESGLDEHNKARLLNRRKLADAKDAIAEKYGLPWNKRTGYSPYLQKVPEFVAAEKALAELDAEHNKAIKAFNEFRLGLEEEAKTDCVSVYEDSEYSEDVWVCKRHLMELAEKLP